MKALISALFFVLVLLVPLYAQEFSYEPDWESIRSHYKVPDWFRDAKFGIFLHWGPYTVPAYSGTKYPKYMYYENWERRGMSPFKHHRETYGDHSVFGYKDFFPMFKAEKFDATEWVTLFKHAGARYVVPVAEHHDGFAMYNSNHTRWNVVDTGPKKAGRWRRAPSRSAKPTVFAPDCRRISAMSWWSLRPGTPLARLSTCVQKTTYPSC